MSSLEYFDNLAVYSMGALGLFMAIISFQASEEMGSDCPSFILRYGWTIIQNISLAIMSIPIIYWFCKQWGGNCYAKEGESFSRPLVFLTLCFILGATAAVLGGLMMKARQDLTDVEKSACGSSDSADRYTIIMMVLGILLAGIPLTMGIVSITRRNSK